MTLPMTYVSVEQEQIWKKNLLFKPVELYTLCILLLGTEGSLQEDWESQVMHIEQYRLQNSII